MSIYAQHDLYDCTIIGDYKGVISAVKSGADVHADKEFALFQAARYNHWDIVRYFITEHKADFKTRNYGCFYSAVRDGNLEIIRLLEDYGLDLHKILKQTALNHAVVEGHLHIIKHLVEKWGVNIYDNYQSAYKLSHLRDHTQIVDYLTSLYLIDLLFKKNHVNDAHFLTVPSSVHRHNKNPVSSLDILLMGGQFQQALKHTDFKPERLKKDIYPDVSLEYILERTHKIGSLFDPENWHAQTTKELDDVFNILKPKNQTALKPLYASARAILLLKACTKTPRHISKSPIKRRHRR